MEAMKTAIALLFLLCVVGCKTHSATPAKRQPDLVAAPDSSQIVVTNTVANGVTIQDNYLEGTPKEDARIKALRDYAEPLNIRWRIQCSDSDGEMYFMAWATPAGGKFAMYVEDGAVPSWFVSTGQRAKTQGQAAAKLLLLLHGKPNDIPEHSPAQSPSRMKCPKPITSEDPLPEGMPEGNQ